MSFSKKLAAVVSAAAVVASMFAAAPASAESVNSFANRYTSSTVFRKVDPTTHQIQYKLNEQISVSGYANLKQSAIDAHINSGDTIKMEVVNTIVSGTTRANPYMYINGSGSYANGMFDISGSTAQEKVMTAVPTRVSMNFNYSTSATSDVTLVVLPKVSVGSYTFVADDFDSFDVTATTGHFMVGSKENAPVVATDADEKISFSAPTVCVDTTGLTSSDTLEVLQNVSDGSATVGTDMIHWSLKNGMQYVTDGMDTTFALTSFNAGNTIEVNAIKEVTPVTAGKSYTFSGFKVVKQGTTTDRSTSCKTTAATGTVSVTNNVVSGNLNIASEAMPGFDSYVCVLYATSDTNHVTAVKSAVAYKYGMNGPTTTPTCNVMGAPAGTYSMGVRGVGYQGISDEIFLPGTVTVTAATPAKKAPKVPTVATKVKVGKTFNITLHSSKGTATKGANADGLATTVVLAASSKAYCSLTKIVKSKKITGFTVKGLKVGTSKCVVTVTVTGNSTYNSLTKVYKVSTTK